MFRIPVITRNLLIINILAFMAMLVFRQMGIADLNSLCGLHFFMAQDFHVYQLVTYMFMHGGWEHIILNMFMLWMFGAVMERVWGPKRFIFYYIFCGIGAGLMQEVAQFFYVWLFGFNQPMGFLESFSVMHHFAADLNSLTTVGASGAIYALLLAFGMSFPDEKMFIIPIPVPIKAKWMVMGSIAIELFSALATPGSQVAHVAHLGGMLFGFFLIRYWQKHPYVDYGLQGGRDIFSNMKNRWEQRKEGYRGWNHKKQNEEWHSSNPDWDYNARKKATQDEVDRILDKIRKSGYDSLTSEEKKTLFDQGNK
jgi:membrane associated rhomboid family serine protease